jgi:hypothetical protein
MRLKERRGWNHYLSTSEARIPLDLTPPDEAAGQRLPEDTLSTHHRPAEAAGFHNLSRIVPENRHIRPEQLRNPQFSGITSIPEVVRKRKFRSSRWKSPQSLPTSSSTMKFLPPSLRRISLNRLEGVEKLAVFIMLDRFAEWVATVPPARFDYANRCRRDMFFLLGAEESVTSLLLGTVGTVFTECVTASIRYEDIAHLEHIREWEEDGEIDLRSTLWSVFIRLGFSAQNEFAKTLNIDPAVVTRVFKPFNASTADSSPTSNARAGITIDRLNQALITAGLVPRFDRLSRYQRPCDRQQPDAAQLDDALTVREWHLVKLAGYIGRLAERSSPHSSYQFIEHFTSLVQCAAESLCWLTASSEPRKAKVTTPVLDTAFEVVCYSLGSVPDMPRDAAAPHANLLQEAAVFGAGPLFCPTISENLDAPRRKWQEILADVGQKAPLEQVRGSQLYSKFATDWCLHLSKSSITRRVTEFPHHANGPFSEVVFDENVLQALGSLEKPSPKLFQQLESYWKSTLHEHDMRPDDPQVRESLFWRFIWEITTAIQTFSFGGFLDCWRKNVNQHYLPRLTDLNNKMKQVAQSLAAGTVEDQRQAELVAEFNEYDCLFHLTLADCFRTPDNDARTTPVRPSQDASLLRRLFAITTLLRSKRRHSDGAGRSNIIIEHQEIINSVVALLKDPSTNPTNAAKQVHHPAPGLLQNYVNSLYRHLFSAPDNEAANSTHPFIPSLAKMIQGLPCIDKYADLQRQWEQCDLMVLLTQGTEPLEFKLAREFYQQQSSLANNLRDLFSTIALSLLNSTSEITCSSRARSQKLPCARFVVLPGNKQSFSSAVELLPCNAELEIDNWEAFKKQLDTGIEHFKTVLLQVCRQAFDSSDEPQKKKSPWSHLVEKLKLLAGVNPDSLPQLLNKLVSIQYVSIPEFAVGAGELRAVSWREDRSVSFTYRKRNSPFIYYGADNESDDRNGLVVQAILRSIVGIPKSDTTKTIETQCKVWLGRNSVQTRGADPGAEKTAADAHVAGLTLDYRVPTTQEETATQH